MSGPPVDPRGQRFVPMARFLRAATIVIAVLGVLAVVAGGGLARGAAGGMVVLLVGVPLARVAWLAARWFRRGDVRYALVAAVVLMIPVVGFVAGRR